MAERRKTALPVLTFRHARAAGRKVGSRWLARSGGVGGRSFVVAFGMDGLRLLARLYKAIAQLKSRLVHATAGGKRGALASRHL